MYFAVLGCVFAYAYSFEAKEREAIASRLSKQLATYFVSDNPPDALVRPPAGFPPLSTVRLLEADIAAILAADEADKRRFAELFGR